MDQAFDERLSALIDGELAPEQAEALRREIAASPELAARHAELVAVGEALRALPARSAPADLRARLAARIAAERHAPPPRRSAFRRAAWAAGLAAAAALAALLVLPARRESPSEQTEPQLAVRPPASPPAEPAPAEPAPGEPFDDLGDAASEEDLGVIAVLDVLTELDELEGSGAG